MCFRLFVFNQSRSDGYEIFRKQYVVEEFSSQKFFWLDMTDSIQVRILILSREVVYLF